MQLPDWRIEQEVGRGNIEITDFCREQLQPASYDLRLHNEIRVPKMAGYGPGGMRLYDPIDCAEVRPKHTKLQTIGEFWTGIEPGGFILATTEEKIRVPVTMAARVEGKSSLGRIGLAVHITAGFIDPGFEGQVTLEIANLAPWPIVLRPGQRIAQIAFYALESAARTSYATKGHYQGQVGPTESKFHHDR